MPLLKVIMIVPNQVIEIKTKSLRFATALLIKLCQTYSQQQTNNKKHSQFYGLRKISAIFINQSSAVVVDYVNQYKDVC